MARFSDRADACRASACCFRLLVVRLARNRLIAVTMATPAMAAPTPSPIFAASGNDDEFFDADGVGDAASAESTLFQDAVAVAVLKEMVFFRVLGEDGLFEAPTVRG